MATHPSWFESWARGHDLAKQDSEQSLEFFSFTKVSLVSNRLNFTQLEEIGELTVRSK